MPEVKAKWKVIPQQHSGTAIRNEALGKKALMDSCKSLFLHSWKPEDRDFFLCVAILKDKNRY